MASGEKSAYTDKQKRQAEHIEEGYEKSGRSNNEAERIAWATVNKESGGGNLSGSGRAHDKNGHDRGESTDRPQRSATTERSSEPGQARRSREERSEAAKVGWATRRSKDALK